MCVGPPLRLVCHDGIVGQARDGDRQVCVDLSLTPDLCASNWLLTSLGAARAILPADSALKIRTALHDLATLKAGGVTSAMTSPISTPACLRFLPICKPRLKRTSPKAAPHA